MLNPHKPFRVIFGGAHDGVLSVVVWSFSSADLILTVGDQQVTLDSWTPVGEDNQPAHSEAMFVASAEIDIPTEFVQLAWTATQAEQTDSDAIWTQPGLRSDFRILELTCNLIDYADEEQGEPNHGCWALAEQLIKDDASPPVAATHLIDDIVYVDGVQIDDTGYSGKVSTGRPDTTLKQFDYALGYAGGFGGLCGNAADPFGCVPGGLIPGLQYTLGNSRFREILGNHELGAGMGRPETVGGTNGAARPNPFHATGTPGVDAPRDGAGIVVYNQLFGPLHGQRLAVMRDANALHYYDDFGPLRVVMTDIITNHTGTLGPTALGDDQIDDVLEMVDTDHPFKVVMLAHTPRAFSDGSAGFHDLSALYPSDYNRLMVATGNTPKSLMDNPRTNGIYGSLTIDQGDAHSGLVKWCYAPADDNVAREHVYVIQLGTVTRTSGLHSGTSFANGYDDVAGSMVCEYRRDAAMRGPHLLERIVYGSEVPPRQHLRMWRETAVAGEFDIAWERHIVQYQGNRGMLSAATPKIALMGDSWDA